MFPAYIRCGALSSYPDYSAISHWHEDIECILILSGAMTYNINGNLIELTKGNGIFVNSRQLHYGFSPSYSECEFACILLSPTLLQVNDWFYNTYIKGFLTNTAYPFIYLDAGIDWMNQILQSFSELSKFSKLKSLSSDPKQKKETAYFDILRHFLFIFESFYKNIPTDHLLVEEQPEELLTLKQMLTYITNHYSQRITLNDIASAGTCCKSKCSILFKKYLHETPIGYTIKYRLNRSLESLIHSNKSISEIAFEYGFCSTSYYCETFGKYYKMSPIKYQKKHSTDS